MGKDHFYGIDALTGRVTVNPVVSNDLATKADLDKAAAINMRGYSYSLDPVTGHVSASPNVRNDLYTKADADRDKAINDRGWYCGLNPSTGKVVRYKSGPYLE